MSYRLSISEDDGVKKRSGPQGPPGPAGQPRVSTADCEQLQADSAALVHAPGRPDCCNLLEARLGLPLMPLMGWLRCCNLAVGLLPVCVRQVFSCCKLASLLQLMKTPASMIAMLTTSPGLPVSSSPSVLPAGVQHLSPAAPSQRISRSMSLQSSESPEAAHEAGVTNVLVTTGQLIPTLGKLLLFQLNQAFGATGKPSDTNCYVSRWVCNATVCAAGASRYQQARALSMKRLSAFLNAVRTALVALRPVH